MTSISVLKQPGDQNVEFYFPSECHFLIASENDIK